MAKTDWLKKDLRYLWHPYTQMKDCEKFPPILIERGRGLKLYDDRGNFYYDTIASWWCNVHGHGNRAIARALRDQADKLEHVLFAGFTHKPAIALAEQLVALTPPGLTKVFFSDNGSTAVEVAMKMSFQYWRNCGIKGKTAFVALDAAYHGDTIGTMAVSGTSAFNATFKPLLFPSLKAPSPYCYRCPCGKTRSRCHLECFDRLEALVKRNHRHVAALILEPLVMAAGGMIVYPVEYLQKAARLAKRYKIHLILDEVATGFGRTGKMFACEHAGVSPDFLCLSKGLTAGWLAMGATLTTQEVYRAFYADYGEQKTFYHGHTYTANPLTCRVALANLAIFRRRRVLAKTLSVIKHFHAGLENMRDLAIVGDVRYLGLIGALELVKDKSGSTPFAVEERIGFKIYREGLKRHLILRPLGNVVYFFLPLTVTRREIDYILRQTRHILADFSLPSGKKYVIS